MDWLIQILYLSLNTSAHALIMKNLNWIVWLFSISEAVNILLILSFLTWTVIDLIVVIIAVTDRVNFFLFIHIIYLLFSLWVVLLCHFLPVSIHFFTTSFPILCWLDRLKKWLVIGAQSVSLRKLECINQCVIIKDEWCHTW